MRKAVEHAEKRLPFLGQLGIVIEVESAESQQIAGALDAAYKAEVSHRDLKPSRC